MSAYDLEPWLVLGSALLFLACLAELPLPRLASLFTARRHTALYQLKSPSTRVAQVLHAVAESLNAHAAARVFSLSETTVRSWLARAGQHSQHLHHRLLRTLHLTHIQLDELRLKLRGATEAAWLWIACDARTKFVPAFGFGPHTQAIAHQLMHDVAKRWSPIAFLSAPVTAWRFTSMLSLPMSGRGFKPPVNVAAPGSSTPTCSMPRSSSATAATASPKSVARSCSVFLKTFARP